MHSKTMQKPRLRRFFFYLFLLSISWLSLFSFLFFFLDSTIDSALEKRLQFFTFGAQMASIKAAPSLINIGEFSCGEVFVITFSFLTRLWLRNFAKNNRYHSAILPNIPISLMVNIFC